MTPATPTGDPVPGPRPRGGKGGGEGTLPSPRGGRRGGKGGRGIPCPPLRGRKPPFFIMQKTEFRRRFRVVFS